MNKGIILASALALAGISGCSESQEVTHAKCVNSAVALGSATYNTEGIELIVICMKAAGYKFELWAEPCDQGRAHLDPACFATPEG